MPFTSQRGAIAILVQREHLVTGGAAELYLVIKGGDLGAFPGHEVDFGGACVRVLLIGQLIAGGKGEEISPQLVIQDPFPTGFCRSMASAMAAAN